MPTYPLFALAASSSNSPFLTSALQTSIVNSILSSLDAIAKASFLSLTVSSHAAAVKKAVLCRVKSVVYLSFLILLYVWLNILALASAISATNLALINSASLISIVKDELSSSETNAKAAFLASIAISQYLAAVWDASDH